MEEDVRSERWDGENKWGSDKASGNIKVGSQIKKKEDYICPGEKTNDKMKEAFFTALALLHHWVKSC